MINSIRTKPSVVGAMVIMRYPMYPTSVLGTPNRDKDPSLSAPDRLSAGCGSSSARLAIVEEECQLVCARRVPAPFYKLFGGLLGDLLVETLFEAPGDVDVVW